MLQLMPVFEPTSALSQIADLDLTDFLGGPGRDSGDIEVDDIFAGTLEQALKDMSLDMGIVFDPTLPVAPDLWECIATEGDVRFLLPCDHRGIPGSGVIATIGNIIVGAYVGCSLAVSFAHRGKGIGKSLVVLRFLYDEELPLWEHDTPGYSTAGYHVHESAYHRLCDLHFSSETSRANA